MIEVPPPKLPALEPAEIRGLIAYADDMADFMQAEMERSVSSARQIQRKNDLTELVDGSKFTAQGLRDSYDGQYWR
jgi:hypothetical protein